MAKCVSHRQESGRSIKQKKNKSCTSWGCKMTNNAVQIPPIQDYETKVSMSPSGTSAIPLYGDQNYWESRYRHLYDSDCKNTTLNGNKTTNGDLIQETESKIQHFGHLSSVDEPLPGHAWYFSYEDLRPLLMDEVIHKLLPFLEKRGSCSILEIGCGDVPVVPDLCKDVAAETGISVNAISTDYSAVVISYLKEQQRESSSNPIVKEKCDGKNPDTLSSTRPMKRSRKHTTANQPATSNVQFHVEDATKLSFQDNQFDIVVEKGALDACISDKEDGIRRCKTIVGEAARVLQMHGAMVIVSHVNAHHSSGYTWLEDVVFPGLFREGKDCSSWVIEVHGNSNEEDENDSEGLEDASDESNYDETNDLSSAVAEDPEIADDSVCDEDESSKYSDEETHSKDGSVGMHGQSSQLGPAVYILWKKPNRVTKTATSNAIEKEEEDSYSDFLKRLDLQLFSY